MTVDTIAAIATPAGKGGVGIVRVSGPDAERIGEVVTGRRMRDRRIVHARFLAADQTPIDDGVVLFFRSPRSYTGEDVLELQGHGGPAVLAAVLERVLALGARAARPGEFTERAFLNDRLTLSQAEAVADLIDAGTRAAARASVRALTGAFAARVDALAAALLALRVEVEAAIDFPDEDIDLLATAGLDARLERLDHEFEQLIEATVRGVRVREGLTVALVGRPNAGKSTLFNRLLGDDRAIVTDTPGTTRDLLIGSFSARGLVVELVDTAGLRPSPDVVEREGIRRARQAATEADLVLLLMPLQALGQPDADPVADIAFGFIHEGLAGAANDLPEPSRTLLVVTKTDLPPTPEAGPEPPTSASIERTIEPLRRAGYRVSPVSALTGEGIEALIDALAAAAGVNPETDSPFSARQRHLDALRRAHALLRAGFDQLRGTGSGELLAEDLRSAHAALGEIDGGIDADGLLGEIFASFCIGK